MSLYHHVANKDEILDGIVDLVFGEPETAAEVAEPIARRISADDHPHLAEMASELILQPGYDFGDEFEFGLGVILDALTRSTPGDRVTPAGRPDPRGRGPFSGLRRPV
jgi:AcrR family transcriptional regulator